MLKRLTTLGRSALGASLTIVTCLACSGTDNSAPGSGGDTSIGGGATGGVPSIGTTGTGGSKASGGTTSGGGVPTGGAVATGGKAAQGGSPATGGALATGGVLGTGGIVATGGVVAAGGKASGGAPPAGGMPATGGSILGSSGTLNAGGANTGGKGTGGAATGGASALGTGGAATGGSTGTGASQCPASTVKAGDTTETITSSGASRSFIVHIPTGYTGQTPLPVIFDFHPLGGTGSSQEGSSGWNTKCDSVGCIAVFPNSASNGSNGWDVGYCCDGAQANKVDDVQFTRDMIKWLQANACVDPKRIYASGCSNGGGMSYMLACNAADVIAAVAPVDFRCITGTQPTNPSSLTATNNTACTCTLPRPISVLAFDEGQDNSIVPYNGGNTVVPADQPPGSASGSAFYFPSAQLNVDTWAHFDSCTGSANTDPTNTICQVYTSCSGNTEVGLCTANSSAHCGSYATAHIVDTAWTMFQKEALP